MVGQTARHRDEMNQQVNGVALEVIEQFDVIRKMLLIIRLEALCVSYSFHKPTFNVLLLLVSKVQAFES